jgi:hypothetical protein
MYKIVRKSRTSMLHTFIFIRHCISAICVSTGHIIILLLRRTRQEEGSQSCYLFTHTLHRLSRYERADLKQDDWNVMCGITQRSEGPFTPLEMQSLVGGCPDV